MATIRNTKTCKSQCENCSTRRIISIKQYYKIELKCPPKGNQTTKIPNCIVKSTLTLVEYNLHSHCRHITFVTPFTVLDIIFGIKS